MKASFLLMASLPLAVMAAAPSLQHPKGMDIAHAARIGQTLVPGGYVVEADLEREDGKVWWEVDVEHPSTGLLHSIQINPSNGAILDHRTEPIED